MSAGGSAATDLDHELALDRLEPAILAAVAEHARAHWERACAGDDRAPPWPVLGDEHAWRAASRAWRTAGDPVLRRRAAVLARALALGHIESDPAVRVATAACASADDASLTAPLSSLASARNAAARRLGFADLPALWLALEELDRARVDAWIAASDDAPAPTSAAASDDGDDVAPCSDETGDALAARLAGALGVRPRVAVVDAPAGVARSFVIAPPHDVRVVWSTAGAGAARRLAHELGHVRYAASWGALPAVLAAPAARFVDEGVAEWCAAHLVGARGPRWLRWQRVRAAAERALYGGGGGEAAAAAYRDGARRQLGVAHELVDDVALRVQLAQDPCGQIAYLGGAAVQASIAARVAGPRDAWLAERLAAGASIAPARWLDDAAAGAITERAD